MTLADQLRDHTRNYWLVPTSESGTVDSTFQIMRVQKGANTPEIELYCEVKEAEMLAIFEDRSVEAAINEVIGRNINVDFPKWNWEKK
jgi:hypothetical protein